MKNRNLSFYLLFILFSCSQKEKTFESNRLEKIALCETFEDPMEIAVSNVGDVFVAERRGKIKKYDATTKLTKSIGQLEVDLGHEDGLLGLTIDPNFDTNGWIYLLYTPKPHHVQRVSRFTFDGKKLNMDTETIIIEYPIVPERHQGGSLAFDNQGNLFISTGENTIPTGINGYAPVDERAGFERSDAQRSAGNTADLRGKILRIKPLANGSYSIPSGNFKEKYNLEKAKPEIYVMGCRNPFRITIDDKTNTLFWGEIGPDAGSDSEKGPRGHDEFNIATEAGFYGWPFFIGNNKSYAKVDFNTDKIISKFDTLKPQNNSPNNTGDRILPKPKQALIWYPYDDSKEFTILGKGGRSALAGAVYHAQFGKGRENALPSYFENKLFIMDWMRHWIMTVSLNKSNKIEKIEPFMPQTKFNRPMDMAVGPEGCLYILEYGENWFGNKNGTLSKIIYNRNNRKPSLKWSSSALVGGVSTKINFNSKGTFDADNDSLDYDWEIIENKTNEKVFTSNAKNMDYTFEKTGFYTFKITVKDDKNAMATDAKIIAIGNNIPNVKLTLDGNQTFYWNNRKLKIQSIATDKEDGNNLSPKNSLHILHSDNILTESSYNSVFNRGKILVQNSDCYSCHAAEKKSVGPSFLTLSQTYFSDNETITKLSKKIITGGSGVWGQSPMSAHPQLSDDQAKLMVRYILAQKGIANQSKMDIGTNEITVNPDIEKDENTFVKIKSSYTDKMANAMPNTTISDSIVLRNPFLQAINYTSSGDIIETNGLARLPFPGSFIHFSNIDLTNAKAIKFEYNYDFFVENCWLELHIDKVNGPIIGKIAMKKKSDNQAFANDLMALIPTIGKKNIFVVYQPVLDLHAPINIKTLQFSF